MSKAMCAACGDVIVSKHRHDFVKCKCGKTFVDGGDDYFRAGGMPIFYAYDEDEEEQLSLDKDCCLETYSEAFREGKRSEQKRTIEMIENTMEGCSPSSNEMFILAGLLKEIKGEQK